MMDGIHRLNGGTGNIREPADGIHGYGAPESGWRWEGREIAGLVARSIARLRFSFVIHGWHIGDVYASLSTDTPTHPHPPTPHTPHIPFVL
jgi:hypothetical protein